MNDEQFSKLLKKMDIIIDLLDRIGHVIKNG